MALSSKLYGVLVGLDKPGLMRYPAGGQNSQSGITNGKENRKTTTTDTGATPRPKGHTATFKGIFPR